MADKKTEKTPAAPSSSKGTRSSGNRKKAKQNQEARRCRKAIRHLEKRRRHERALRVKGHLNMVLKGERSQDLGRSKRRTEHEKIVEVKTAAKRAREAAKNAASGGGGTPQPTGSPG